MADWNGDGHDDWLDDCFLYAMLSNLNNDTDTSDGCGCFGCLSWVFIAYAVFSLIAKLLA